MIEPKIIFQTKKDLSKLTEEKTKKMHAFLSSANESEESTLNTKSSKTIKTEIVTPIIMKVESSSIEEDRPEITVPMFMNTEEVSPPANEKELLDVINELVPDSPEIPKKKSSRKKKATPSE